MGKRNKQRRGGNKGPQQAKGQPPAPGAVAQDAAAGADRDNETDADPADGVPEAAHASDMAESVADVHVASGGDGDGDHAGLEIRQTAAPGAPAVDGDIRGVLIQVAGGRLLLPNATIAEVLSYADPEPVDGAPDWLLGRIRWRGWLLPLVAFSRLTGTASDERGGLGSKVLVVKAFGGNAKLPFFALLTQGFPRLVTVSREGLVEIAGEDLHDAVHAAVRLNEDEALLPDIDRVEALLAEALANAA